MEQAKKLLTLLMEDQAEANQEATPEQNVQDEPEQIEGAESSDEDDEESSDEEEQARQKQLPLAFLEGFRLEDDN